MIKKLLLIFAVLLFAVPALADGIYQPVARGTVAAADIAVTLTAGSADVDLSSATIPRNYKGHLLKIYDANNVLIQGYVYTDGAGTVQNIVSAKGGTTRNWAQQGAGFDDTTNCRYEIYRVLQAPVIATHSISAGNALMDTTTANAFAAPVGVDLTAYQDGKHILALYNASGYAAAGWISATAPSGESLTDVLTYATLNLTTGWTPTLSTITDADSFVNTTANGFALKSLMSPGKLYKSSLSATVSGGTARIQGSSSNPIYAINGGGDKYATATNDSLVIGNVSGGIGATTDITAINVASVDMPAATGALLLSSKGGSRGYIFKHCQFRP